jgi:hypothetical protein
MSMVKYCPIVYGALIMLISDAGCSMSRRGPGMDDPLADLSSGGGGDDDLGGNLPVDLVGADFTGGGGLADLSGSRDMSTMSADLRAAGDLSSARPPCTRGPGFVAWRFHYEAGSTSARRDIYSLPDDTNWTAVPAYATSVVDLANGGGLNIASGNWILIRYSVRGLSTINSATLSMFGRSYSTGSSGSFIGWSPIYGDAIGPVNSVSNAWPYRWTSIDFTGYVKPMDDPGLTGIRFKAGPNSGNLVINTVELCIDGA